MSDSITTLQDVIVNTTKINIPPGGIHANSVDVIFNGLPGNQPDTYGNLVALWQNNNSIPYGTNPKLNTPVIGNSPDGSFTFEGLDLTNNSYIIGYSVGPILTATGLQTYGNICSTVFIPANSSEVTTFSPSLKVMHIGTTSVSLEYSLPQNILPKTNGAWIGIWRSGQPSYTTPPLASSPISQDAPESTCSINGFNIGRGLTYTIGLFTSGFVKSGVSKQSAMATSLTFTNS